MNISPSTIPHVCKNSVAKWSWIWYDPGMGFSIVFQSITIHNIVQPLHIISQNYTYLNFFTLKTNRGFLTFFKHTSCLISCYVTLCASLRWVPKAMKQQRDQTLRENVERVEARDRPRTGGWTSWTREMLGLIFLAMENGKMMNYPGTLFEGPIKWRIKLRTGRTGFQL